MYEAAARLFDPTALAIVTGGSFVAAAFSATREDIGRALRALGPLFRRQSAKDAIAAERAVRDIERLVEVKGVGCADHVQTRCVFVRRAALNLVDAPTADTFTTWADQEIEDRQTRHEAAARVWRAVADAAPTMGMIGTVLGLIGMFAQMDDPDGMGAAMAVAMLTTLYGLFLSAIVAGPIAARLERLSAAELRWQRSALDRLAALARDASPERRLWLRQHLRIEG